MPKKDRPKSGYYLTKTIKEETLISIYPNDNDNETVSVHKVWGNILQQQELPKWLDDYFGSVCRNFFVRIGYRCNDQ